MKNTSYTLLLSFLFLFIVGNPVPSLAQGKYIFNFNIYNGLPSNHVYNSIVDRNGYLWLATTKGVVKYNGYSFRVFNFADGLPKEDVWRLVEDKKGRIWLGCIADELGYIYNDKYYTSNLNNNHHTVYPNGLSKFQDGVIFSCAYLNGTPYADIYVALNDSVYKHAVNRNDYRNYTESSKIDNKIINKRVIIPPSVFVPNNSIPFYTLNGYIYNMTPNGLRLKISSRVKISDSIANNELTRYNCCLLGEYIILGMNFKCNYFKIINRNTGKTKKVQLPDYNVNENISFIQYNYDDSSMFIHTANYVVKFISKNDILFRGIDTLNRYATINESEKVNICNIWTDPFWGKICATTANGFFLTYKYENNYIKKNITTLAESRYLGGIDGTYYWWSPANTTIYKMNESNEITRIKCEGITNLNSAISYNTDTILLLGQIPVLFDTKNNKIVHINYLTIGAGIYHCFQDNNDFICISNFGFYTLHTDTKHSLRNGKYNIELFLNRDRFLDLIYNKFDSNYIAFNNNLVCIYNHKTKKQKEFTKELLRTQGINKIESIKIDTHSGNVILKDNEKICIWNYNKNTTHEILKGINVKEAFIGTYKNVLVVAGRQGVLFCKIIKNDSISPPLIYNNIKNVNFTYVNDMQISQSEIILNTDKGLFGVKKPEDTLFNNIEKTAYSNFNFTLKYRNEINRIFNGDTISINQKEIKLQFDVINPYGNGPVVYTAQFSDHPPYVLNANELDLSAIEPNRYYTLKVRVNDDVWKSDEIILNLYIEPYWWQTPNRRVIIWTVGILLVIFLFTVSILITRRLVLNSAKKKNLRMELELKSIYAQINPHFIFNSLNSALLLVSKNKMEDAYAHISKFSRLLRSYIKSSRNRFITIEEEIKNLRNYIELQQVRFKEKINYTIEIGKDVSINEIKIPSLLLQPFVENAINHGLLSKEDGGNLKIEFILSDEKQQLLCIIDDDGVGRKQSRINNDLNQTKDESYGDLLIKDLISIFNKYENMDISVSYKDKEVPLSGTTVTIEIKYQNNI